mmetsp:Transcript_39177/g.87613  ORF Transcript_39177/g.87613 Transcript_39177/m.87613 type:complete len:266 (+) Transcript_39177:369-1166(+)
MVPAFAGLFAPHWREDARGTICGLTAFHTRAHLAKAALDSAAFQAYDVLEAMEKDSSKRLGSIKVDGGMSVNSPLLQFQADVADVAVSKPAIPETTAVGACYAAGLAVGFWHSTDELAQKWKESGRFVPAMPPAQRARLLWDWNKAVRRAMGWVDGGPPAGAAVGASVGVGARGDIGSGGREPKSVLEAPEGPGMGKKYPVFFDDEPADGPRAYFDDDEVLDQDRKGGLRKAARKANKVARSLPPLVLLAVGVLGGLAVAKLTKK